MRLIIARIGRLPPALLVLSFVSGFVGGASVSTALHRELAFQFVRPALAEMKAVPRNGLAISQSPAATQHSFTVTSASTASDVSAPQNVDHGIDPDRIRIPAINVDASVIDLGLNPDGTLQVPEDFSQTGWWTGGANPGDRGSAVIVGHVDSQTGSAVFYRLQELQPGDEIHVMDAADRVVSFEVESIQQVPKDTFPTDAVYGTTPEPTLRLITCGGTFDSVSRRYLDNVIVFASRSQG